MNTETNDVVVFFKMYLMIEASKMGRHFWVSFRSVFGSYPGFPH